VVTWSSDSSRVPPEQQIRDSLIRSMDANGATPSTFLDLLDAVTQEETWRKLKDRRGRAFLRFTDFVIAERPEGLGLHGKDDLRKHLALEHKEEREPYRRQATIDRMAAMRRRVNHLLGEDVLPTTETRGGDHRSPEYQKRTTFLVGPSDTADKTVARLKRDDPDLAQQVIGGEISPHAAARRKGWRKPRIVLSSPDRVARKLRDHFKDPEQRRLLAELLMKPEN
jgi:hypothetical protein